MNKKYDINSIVIMKKQHPCGGNEWKVLRKGIDVKIECLKCNRIVMLNALEFEKRIKKVVEKNV